MGAMEKMDELTSSSAREYLTFRLDQEEYGIDILKVQEIRGYEPPTRIANSPEFIKGVVNLRGVIVPIVDMRIRFGLSDVQYSGTTVTIVLNIAGRTVGMVVVEAEGSRVVLLVDELLGQQQVVVKNLESNYRKVPNVSGATILGDGTVALILDTGALVRRSRH